MRQVFLLTLLLITFLSNGQTRTITGKVLYDDFSPIYESKIWIYDTLQLATTDLNGDFKIELPPNLDEVEIALRLRKRSPEATPNVRVVAIADEILGRSGRMARAIEKIGRGTEAFEGSTFAFRLDE